MLHSSEALTLLTQMKCRLAILSLTKVLFPIQANNPLTLFRCHVQQNTNITPTSSDYRHQVHMITF